MAKKHEKSERDAPQGGNKRKATDLAVSTIEKQFGKGAILTMTDDAVNREIGSFPSGSPSLDIALGIGGYPRGRVVERHREAPLDVRADLGEDLR